MTERKTRIRLATTALAAALAISSTSLPAQDAPVPDTAAETPVAPAPDPLSPEPVTDTAAETPAEASETTAAPARPTATRRAATRTPARPAQSPRSTPVAEAAPAPAAAVAAAPVEAAPVAQAPPPAPAEPPPVELTDNGLTVTDEMLPIAGAALVGLLALVGAFLLIRRRRRLRQIEDEEVYYEPAADWAEPEPVMTEPSREPAFAVAPVAASATAAAPIHDPVPAGDQSTGLPAGFDLSRFGPHVQAAYRGPTPDNPSASLKHRIRQAGAMDRAEGNYRCEPASAEPADATVAARPQTDPASGDFMLRRGEAAAEGRPAYNKVD